MAKREPLSRIGKSVAAARDKAEGAQRGAKGSKKGRKVIPIGERERIAAMHHVLGKSKRAIARELHHGHRHVAKIIAESDQAEYLKKIRGGFIGLGDSANACLKREMDKGNFELAKWFLERCGALADNETRDFATRIAGVVSGNPDAVHNAGLPNLQSLLPEQARDLILSALSKTDRQIFAVLTMDRVKSEAYGVDPTLVIPDRPTPLNPYSKEEQEPDANANGA